MADEQKKYDVAIIGSGIGGSTLASVLARQGLSVIVFEGGAHLKFAVGESMILETSEMIRALAEFYDVPELAYFSSENYFKYAGLSRRVKRHFSFVHHNIGQEQGVKLSLQAVIPKQPYGHEMHLYRQDTNYFLTSVAISYGATILQSVSFASWMRPVKVSCARRHRAVHESVAVVCTRVCTALCHRILKLSRTIADLAGSDAIQSMHLTDTLQYRPKTMRG